MLNTVEVDEAKGRIAEWKATPEALEEGAVCPIAEVRTRAHMYICACRFLVSATIIDGKANKFVP